MSNLDCQRCEFYPRFCDTGLCYSCYKIKQEIFEEIKERSLSTTKKNEEEEMRDINEMIYWNSFKD